MRYFFALIVFSLLISSCDDGDVITVNLNFEDSFNICGDESGIVLSKINNDPSESLSIALGSLTREDLTTNFFEGDLNQPEVTEVAANEPLSNSNNKFNYRTYNVGVTESDLFCNDIPNNIQIITDDESETGQVIITTTVIEDDNDGIPANQEDDNADGDNNPTTNPTDTDNDGVPNYLDVDDDGDNVLTVDEDINQDGDPTNDDSDGDTIPDYLDTDDDGDGVLTRDEENFVQDQNPTNDETNSGEGPDYLNPNVSTVVPAVAFREHTITREFTVEVTVLDITLSNLAQDEFYFGSKQEPTQVITKETVFN